MLGAIAAIWLLAFIVPKIPTVQQYLGEEISQALEQKLGTKVHIGQVGIRLPWRVIIDDVIIYDQQNKQMLQAGRIAAGIELLPLMEGKIRITSAQLFTTNINLYQKDAHSPLNCQFLIDSLKSKDTTSHTPLNLAIASVIIRHSSLKYDRLDMPETNGKFNTHHLSVNNLSSNIILQTLTDDSLNVDIKHLSLNEQSGLQLDNLKGIIQISENKARISEFSLELPNSRLMLDDFIAPLNKDHGNGSMVFSGYVTISDLSFLEPKLSSFNKRLILRVRADGSAKNLRASISALLKDKSLKLNVSVNAHDIFTAPHGSVNISDATVSQRFITSLANLGLTIPRQVTNLGDISLKGNALMENKSSFSANINISTQYAGKASFKGSYHDKAVTAHIQTPGLALDKITKNNKFGNIICNLDIHTSDISNINKDISIKGSIPEMRFNNYTYHGISLDASLHGNILSGNIDINDPNVLLHANGTADIAHKYLASGEVDLRNFSPKNLNLTDIFGDERLIAQVYVDPHKLSLSSNIIDLNMEGNIDLPTLPYSISNIIASQLPSLPFLPKHIKTHNNFRINSTVKDIAFLQNVLKSNIKTEKGVTLDGFINDNTKTADLTLDIPVLFINGTHLSSSQIHFYTLEDVIKTTVNSSLLKDKSIPVDISLDCTGKDDFIHSVFSWDNHRDDVFRGDISADIRFKSSFDGSTSVSSVIPYSYFQVGDSIWSIQAQQLTYAKNTVVIDNFRLGNTTQGIHLNGTLSKNPQDSLVADLQDVDIRYILNLINFHSVDFDGRASGHFVAHNIFNDLSANGYLDIAGFKFDNGNFGDMHLDAEYDNFTKRINIDALCDDPLGAATTKIGGFISTGSGSGLNLDIQADNTRLEFMQTYCKSFMNNVALHGTGEVHLFGPFSAINLEGTLIASGAFTLSSTNCRYILPADTIKFIPDDILLNHIALKDRYGNKAIAHGAIHHKHITRMSYDIDVTTPQFLAYDVPTLTGDNTFCCHTLIKGNVGIHGSGNELTISANATPLKGTTLTYNAASSDAVSNGEIITWRSANQKIIETSEKNTTGTKKQSLPSEKLDNGNDRTNIHMNIQVHTNPDTKLHILMDPISGDYINLCGTGDLRVEYYNKGSFNMFGNYEIEQGIYKMTLQNVIRRYFTFRKGGVVTFGGDPYEALINAHAVYTLNSVPLADLNIGSNFASNNVPVNCLMNIMGTPSKPKIAFSVELPTMSSEARQMVNSIINSEEEMNQQVIYLLAVGRFYAPNATNYASSSTTANTEVSQSSLAIQSFLSGTLSQSFTNALNSVMSNILKNGNNISLGANIAPGNEGFNNAEYEGILSGSFFNNRLIFNGQFGYRDRIATNTSSFIGDFSLQYVLTRKGGISLKVYNQANDRYFTKNALNTQGIGVVFQREWGK